VSHGTTELQRPVPLYMQVVQQLRAQIAAGELAEGDRLPSQREMMARWHISMQTASKVIGALKTEGLAVATVGRDTVVAPGAVARIAAAAASITLPPVNATTQEAGIEVIVSAGKAAAPEQVAEALGTTPGRRVLRREETTLADGSPVTVAVSWFPAAVADKAPKLSASESIPAGATAYLAEAAGMRPARGEEETAATIADQDTAQALSIAPGSPVLATRTRYRAADGQVLQYTETATIPDRWRPRSYTISGG
jgi:DNA-binding GntR family transcriptional regulator